MHGLCARNNAFDHPARHETTWQGQPRDVATNQVVPIYNMIDSILCPHSHKSLLQDSRSYDGTKLTSDCLVVVRANISRVFGVWGKCTRTTTKSIHYATQQLAEPVIRLEYQLCLAQSVADLLLKAKPAQEQWQNITDATRSAAESTIGTIPQPNAINISSVQSWHRCLLSRDLCLCINNTTDDQ